MLRIFMSLSFFLFFRKIGIVTLLLLFFGFFIHQHVILKYKKRFSDFDVQVATVTIMVQ